MLDPNVAAYHKPLQDKGQGHAVAENVEGGSWSDPSSQPKEFGPMASALDGLILARRPASKFALAERLEPILDDRDTRIGE